MSPEILPVISPDQVRSTLSLYRTEDALAPVVVCMPAMGVRASFYSPLAEAIAARGVHCVTADLRGHGSSSVRASRRTNFGYYEMIQYDWPAVLDCVRLHLPDSPIWLLGHSLGGQLSSLYMAEQPGSVAGLILLASCNVYYKGYAKPLRTLAGTQLLRGISEIWGYMPGDRIGFAGREARRLIRDWARNARTGDYYPERSPINYERLLEAVTKPVLAISFESDELAPAEAVANLYRKMPSAEVTHWRLTDADFGGACVGHFNWIKYSESLAQRVGDWLERSALQSESPLAVSEGS
ncbi:alpha/beta fold hydrolase [Hahella sp. CR1]|uniref:alpha/beta hydrolase family protein n=1 Tax=Hahella sp. CR1 TaxID=2992807 RepID=UPI002442E6C3|nr:alpha/beta fold hydrolase [Hahella sp. CR1]MDG9668910.1 alpha/beta fold hydrolase [Hahella sp. CR1]